MGLALLAAGCGGGGSGSDTQTLSGRLVDQSGATLSGYRVVFDGNGQLSGVTNGAGQFVIVIPNASVMGQDTISVYNAAGVLEDVEALPSPFTGVRVFRATIPSAGPPTPPGV